jgi:hypothetical protein
MDSNLDGVFNTGYRCPGPGLAIVNGRQCLAMTLQGIPDPRTSLSMDLVMPGKSLIPPASMYKILAGPVFAQ